MDNLKKEVKLFTRDGESLVNGKTIKHCFKYDYHPHFIILGFTDDSWGVIEDDSRHMSGSDDNFDIDTFKHNLTPGEPHTDKALRNMIAAGVLSDRDCAQLATEGKERAIKDIKARIKSDEEDIVRLANHLVELEK